MQNVFKINCSCNSQQLAVPFFHTGAVKESFSAVCILYQHQQTTKKSLFVENRQMSDRRDWIRVNIIQVTHVKLSQYC